MKVGEKKVIEVTEKATGKVRDHMTFEVHQSRAFDYGNKTVVTVDSETGFGLDEVYDTRYYTGTFENFVKKVINDKYNTTDYNFK